MKYTKAIAAVAGTVAALALAPSAHADESDFLNDVGAHGVVVAPITLTVGHQVCSTVGLYGPSGFDIESAGAARSGVSVDDAAAIMVYAIHDLCPSNIPALNTWLATDYT
jgi:ApbE superfamily uncharacterized protein (UPF0280 family)